MNCPKCGEECDRDSVDIGVGLLLGPWGCWRCGWSDDPRYDSSAGRSKAATESGSYVDPLGGLWPTVKIDDNEA